MKTYEFDCVGISDLMFGRAVHEKLRPNETHEQKEELLWKEKVNVAEDGQCFIPCFAMKNALESAAKRLQRKVPGMKGTFTKLFTQGIQCFHNFPLFNHKGDPITLEDIESRRLFVPSDGRRGSGKRVMRIFPTVGEWQFHGTILVYDDRIDESTLREHAIEVGMFIGFGAMRAENGGINGRFEFKNLKLCDIAKAA